MTDTTPTYAPPVAPVTPEADLPPAPVTPELPKRSIGDVIAFLDDFSAIEWLSVVRELDMASHEVQSDAVIAALAAAVVEDARANGFWQWERFGAMSANALYEHLRVDLEAAQNAAKSGPTPPAAPSEA